MQLFTSDMNMYVSVSTHPHPQIPHIIPRPFPTLQAPISKLTYTLSKVNYCCVHWAFYSIAENCVD